MGQFLSLQRASQQTAQEVASQEDVNQQGGQCGKERTSHLHVPRNDLASSHVVQRDRDGPRPVASKHHRKQEVIPCGGELPDQHHYKAWNGDRQEYPAINSQHVSAVYFGGFQQLLRETRIVVAEGQRCNGNAVNDMRQYQGRDASHPNVAQCVVDKDHERDQDGLVGDEHPEQDEREDEVRSAELPLGKDKSVQRTQHGRYDRRRDDHDETIPERGSQFIEGFDVIIEMDSLWQVPHGLEVNLCETLETRHQQDIHGDEIEDRHCDQWNV